MPHYQPYMRPFDVSTTAVRGGRVILAFQPNPLAEPRDTEEPPIPRLIFDPERAGESLPPWRTSPRAPGTSDPCGFTLLELLIAVAIVAILAAVAYPSYRDHIIRANRSAAQSVMLDLANRQQQFFAANRRYASEAELGFTGMPPDLAGNYVNDAGDPDDVIALSAGPPPTFTITFAPVTTGPQASDGTLTLDNVGNRTPAGKW